MIAEVILKVAGFDRFQNQVPYYPRPSLAGPERCLRALCYEAQGFPKKLSDRFYAIVDDSSWHEELSLDILRKSSFQVHSEQMSVECGRVIHNGTPFTIKGRIDGILTDLAGNDWLLEHKAINHFSFEKYWSEEYPMDYLTQMVLYFVGVSKIQPDIRGGVLLIKNKNTSQYLEFLVDYDIPGDLLRVIEVVKSDGMKRDGMDFKDLYRQAIERFEQVENHRRNKTLPSRQYELGSWQCSYCSFEEMCNSAYEAEFASLSGEIEEMEEVKEEVEKYIELNNLKKRLEKDLDEKKERLKAAMKERGIKKARSNGYILSLSLQKRKSIDKELIPPEVLQSIQKETLVEVLNVKSGKE